MRLFTLLQRLHSKYRRLKEGHVRRTRYLTISFIGALMFFLVASLLTQWFNLNSYLYLYMFIILISMVSMLSDLFDAKSNLHYGFSCFKILIFAAMFIFSVVTTIIGIIHRTSIDYFNSICVSIIAADRVVSNIKKLMNDVGASAKEAMGDLYGTDEDIRQSEELMESLRRLQDMSRREQGDANSDTPDL